MRLCGEAGRRARLGACGISLIDETFHRDLMVGKLEALYEGLARRGR